MFHTLHSTIRAEPSTSEWWTREDTMHSTVGSVQKEVHQHENVHPQLMCGPGVSDRSSCSGCFMILSILTHFYRNLPQILHSYIIHSRWIWSDHNQKAIMKVKKSCFTQIMLYNFSSTHAHTHTHFYLTPLLCASRMANIGPQSIAYLNACNHFSDPTKPCEHKQIRRLHLEKTCMYTRAKVDGTFPTYYSIDLYKPNTHLLEMVWHVLWPRMTTGCLGQSNHITNLKKDAGRTAIGVYSLLRCIYKWYTWIEVTRQIQLRNHYIYIYTNMIWI